MARVAGPPGDSEDERPTEELPPLPHDAPSVGDGFRLLQKIGEGGMGEVWLADQLRPIKRRVAVKVIKHGMDTKSVVARFDSERQALALMEHPCIAKIFDAGATELGRPYFVMEYVPGVRITEHCDRNHLSFRERLQLFIQVCEGVQHAHQKAIIHRDIKSSNILISIQDNQALPKIIDFGVAKATAQRLTEKTLFTEMGQLIGTPEYMSPEQADLTSQDIDTRTDVYSLGVTLYQLLVGALPFDPTELRQAGFDGIRHKIREEDPPRPSTRVRSLGDKFPEAAKNRRTEPANLVRQLQGDLDWIVMKALEKDRSRRYGSPHDLAADIGRYLNHQPVEARPPSTAYRLTKFVRRHTVGVTLAGVVVLLLAGFAVAMAIQTANIARERNRANREAETATRVSEYLVDLFRVSDPGQARGNTITARELLDKGAAQIEESLSGQPLIQARMMETIGVVYGGLGLYDQSRDLLEHALEVHRVLLGDEAPETIDTMLNLANLYRILALYDKAEPLIVEALAARRQRLGEHHQDTLRPMHQLGTIYAMQGRLDEAEPVWVSALEGSQAVGDAELSSRILEALGNVNSMRGRYAEAEFLWRRALELRDPDDPTRRAPIHNLAYQSTLQERFDDAEVLFLEALEIERRVLGIEHQDTLLTMNDLATVYGEQGRLEDAEELFLKALELRRSKLGGEHPDTLQSMSDLAKFYWSHGRLEDARPLVTELLLIRRSIAESPNASPLALIDSARIHLSCVPNDLRDPEAALTFALKANELTDFEESGYLETLAEAYYRVGNSLMAIETQRKAISQLPTDSSRIGQYEKRLAEYEEGLLVAGV